MLHNSIQINTTGESGVLTLTRLPKPELKTNDVLIRLEYAGVNFIDIYFRRGIYKAPVMPFIPGKEGVGIVEAVGQNVSRFSPGERVGFAMGAYGSYTEYAAEHEDRLFNIPDGIPADIACAALLQGFTAHYLLNSSYPVKKGDKILVHAAAGGVGQLLCQMARQKGAYTIATVSDEKKKQIALKCGADEVIVYEKNGAFSEPLKQILGTQKLDAVYDSVGQPTFEQGLSFLKPRGMMILFGQSGGVVAPFDLNRLNTYGSLFVTRPSLGHYLLTPEETAVRAGDVFGMIINGSLKIQIGNVYPLADAGKAHDDLENRRTTGKSLLKL